MPTPEYAVIGKVDFNFPITPDLPGTDA